MKLPRDVSGSDLVKALKRLGYVETRQTGSHIRLTLPIDGEHHLTVSAHDPLKLGTLAAGRSPSGERLFLFRGRDSVALTEIGAYKSNLFKCCF